MRKDNFAHLGTCVNHPLATRPLVFAVIMFTFILLEFYLQEPFLWVAVSMCFGHSEVFFTRGPALNGFQDWM